MSNGSHCRFYMKYVILKKYVILICVMWQHLSVCHYPVHMSLLNTMPVIIVHLLPLKYIYTLMQDTLNSHLNWTLNFCKLRTFVTIIVHRSWCLKMYIMWQEWPMAIIISSLWLPFLMISIFVFFLYVCVCVCVFFFFFFFSGIPAR